MSIYKPFKATMLYDFCGVLVYTENLVYVDECCWSPWQICISLAYIFFRKQTPNRQLCFLCLAWKGPENWEGLFSYLSMRRAYHIKETKSSNNCEVFKCCSGVGGQEESWTVILRYLHLLMDTLIHIRSIWRTQCIYCYKYESDVWI